MPRRDMARFEYAPLGDDEIRVIGFEADDGPTRLTLRSEKRPGSNLPDEEGRPAYHALSYAWGPGERDHQIFVNGTEFFVSADLEGILQYLRSNGSLDTPTLLLWIDAICIDQANNREKSVQVSRMKETYENACDVIIWLGDKPERRESTGLAASFLSEHIPLGADGRVPVLQQPDYMKDPENATVMRTIGQDVLRRSWWWRMWVIQEVSVAKSVVVICDQHRFSWERLGYIATWIGLLRLEYMNAPPEDLAKGNSYLPNIRFKSLYQWKLMHGQEIPILELLQNASSCLATDPRDMIFAVLGLASDIPASPTVNSEHELVCDYSRSVQEVYIDFTKVHIHRHNSLNIVTFSTQYEGRLAGLPSWVPDWSNLRTSSCFSLAEPSLPSAPAAALHKIYFYRASGDSRPTYEFLSNGSLLTSGIRVGQIAQVGECYAELGPPGDEFDHIIEDWKTLALGDNLSRALEPYNSTDETRFEAFDRTITADTNLVGERAQEHERFLFLTTVLRKYLVGGISAFNRGNIMDTISQWSQARRTVQLRILRRRFFTTSSNYFGLGPRNARAGDAVFVVFGCNVPIVLRQTDSGWLLVGEAFVTGIMDGEQVEQAECSNGSNNKEPEGELRPIVEQVLIN
ncbi:HET-domain-containing protein [Thozetella sp. PMI_491]|nr:HET-domain-containing protein [Thozetella sp. PMI_491]